MVKTSILRLAAAIIAMLMAYGAVAQSKSQEPGRAWIAGRYDGNCVIIYFDAVHFGNERVPNAKRIIDPVAGGFFLPMTLTASYIADFFKGPGTHRFAIGEKYDVIIGPVAIPVTLTTLVGTQGDEGVGNDSYIGALATVVDGCDLYGAAEYYVVRPHREPACGSKFTPGHPVLVPKKFATLVDEPVQFAVQTQIVSLLTKSMASIAPEAQQSAIQGRSPAFRVQPFQTADGGLRYYATAEWKSRDKSQRDFSLGAWLSPVRTLHILAVEADQSQLLPAILNVGDLGEGRTGIILANGGEDHGSTDLYEYRDGFDMANMQKLQSIAAGE
jgi:hypothetical protein